MFKIVVTLYSGQFECLGWNTLLDAALSHLRGHPSKHRTVMQTDEVHDSGSVLYIITNCEKGDESRPMPSGTVLSSELPFRKSSPGFIHCLPAHTGRLRQDGSTIARGRGLKQLECRSSCTALKCSKDMLKLSRAAAPTILAQALPSVLADSFSKALDILQKQLPTMPKPSVPAPVQTRIVSEERAVQCDSDW